MKVLKCREFEYPTLCVNCGTEVEVEKDDFTASPNTYRHTPATHYRVHWKCPQCGQEHALPDDVIRKDWADYLALKAKLPSRKSIEDEWFAHYKRKVDGWALEYETSRTWTQKIWNWLRP